MQMRDTGSAHCRHAFTYTHTCRCIRAHMATSAAGKNKYKCSDGSAGACKSTQICYARWRFPKGRWLVRIHGNACVQAHTLACSYTCTHAATQVGPRLQKIRHARSPKDYTCSRNNRNAHQERSPTHQKTNTQSYKARPNPGPCYTASDRQADGQADNEANRLPDRRWNNDSAEKESYTHTAAQASRHLFSYQDDLADAGANTAADAATNGQAVTGADTNHDRRPNLRAVDHTNGVTKSTTEQGLNGETDCQPDKDANIKANKGGYK